MKCSKLEHNSLPYQYLDVNNNSLILKCQICYLYENEQQQQNMVLITDKEKMKMQLQNIYQNKSVEQQQLHATIGVKSKECRKILDQIDEQFQQYAEQQIQINQSSLEETLQLIEKSEGILKIIDIYKEKEKKINQISFQIEKLMTQVQQGLTKSLKQIFEEKQNYMLKEAQLKYQIPEYLIQQFQNLDDCLENLLVEHCNNYDIILTQKPDQIYIGGVNECGNRHGLGMQLNSSDKQFYNGFWIENHFYQGSVLDLKKQELFQGTIKEIDQKYTICGKGFWTNANKEIYKGEFLMGKFEGFGVKINKDNSKYEGNFKQGIFHGKGKLQFDDKTFINGNFIEGHLNGKGEFVCPEYIYEGSYQNDLKHGTGTYLEIKTNIKYQGEFFKNERHGEGILEIPNKYKYKGQFQNGQQSGEGEEEYFIEKKGKNNKEKKQIDSILQELVDSLTKIRVVEKGNYIKNQKQDIFLCKYFQGDNLIKEWQPFNLFSYKQYDNGIELGEF